MKLPSTITLPREVKRFVAGTAFATREDRNHYVRLMVALEYDRQRMLKSRNHHVASSNDGD